MALERIWRAAGSNAPPRRTFAPACATCPAILKICSRDFHRARSGHDDDIIAAYLYSVSKFDDGAFLAKGAPRQFIRGADAMNVFDTREDFKVTGVEVNARADSGEDGLSFSGGAVDREAHAISGVR